jgi:hypothetical protein
VRGISSDERGNNLLRIEDGRDPDRVRQRLYTKQRKLVRRIEAWGSSGSSEPVTQPGSPVSGLPLDGDAHGFWGRETWPDASGQLKRSEAAIATQERLDSLYVRARMNHAAAPFDLILLPAFDAYCPQELTLWRWGVITGTAP